ncbi:MAG TPA: hypothetical protein VGZ91_11735, partial [Candidatus Sulfotelmatobacter sp.]|nr:hypothetical protein [Candidatus Sulfotelmatobacter sp.]
MSAEPSVDVPSKQQQLNLTHDRAANCHDDVKLCAAIKALARIEKQQGSPLPSFACGPEILHAKPSGWLPAFPRWKFS